LEGFLNLFQVVIQDRYLHVGMPPEYSKLPSSTSFCGKACFLHSEYSFQDFDTEDPELTDPETGIINKLG